MSFPLPFENKFPCVTLANVGLSRNLRDEIDLVIGHITLGEVHADTF